MPHAKMPDFTGEVSDLLKGLSAEACFMASCFSMSFTYFFLAIPGRSTHWSVEGERSFSAIGSVTSTAALE